MIVKQLLNVCWKIVKRLLQIVVRLLKDC